MGSGIAPGGVLFAVVSSFSMAVDVDKGVGGTMKEFVVDIF